MNKQPVIILGMHRSGTTMITKILEQLGLFVGDRKELNHEALFFWEINNWIFDLHTARPELPHNLQYTNPKTRQIIEESLQYFIKSSRKKKYLGSLHSQYPSLADLDFNFGWKDPKNIFTIDFWKTVFPHPKIIHVYRNPMDCVSSYIERDLVLKNKFEWNWKKKLKRRFLIAHNFNYNFRLFNMEQGYQLWLEYVGKAVRLQAEYPDYLEIKYETFLQNPEPEIRKLCQFCNLSPAENTVQNQINTLQKNRAYSFLNHPAYVDFYQKIKNDALMEQLGYADIMAMNSEV
jgi:hypothetical protein